MKSNPYKIDDAEEFEPTLASPVKSWERDKIHTLFAQELKVNRGILLLRAPSWRHSSFTNIDSLACPYPTSLPLPPPFVMGSFELPESSVNQRQAMRGKGEWALHPICAPCPGLSIGKRKKKPWSRGLSWSTEDSHNFDQIKWKDQALWP